MRPSIAYSDPESVVGKAITQRDMRDDGPPASAHEPIRRAAGYLGRIFRGEKPAGTAGIRSYGLLRRKLDL